MDECKPLADGDIMFLSYKYIWHQGPGYAGELDSVFAVLRGIKTTCAMTGVWYGHAHFTARHSIPHNLVISRKSSV